MSENNKTKIKKLIAVNIPLSACNLKCHYCYISQRKDWEKKDNFKLDPEKIRKAFSNKRLGGPCIINLTGKGETLIQVEIVDIIRNLLEEGHFLEVVTNGTLYKRFDEIFELPGELLRRLEFKISFHYLELKKRNEIDQFFENIDKLRKAGCAFTLELMPNDEVVPYIDEIQKICMEKVGALCHLTIGRDENDGKKILTNMPVDDYLKTWKKFDSNMFDFKYSVFGVKRQEFCYAGMWSLYVNLATGDARQCYGFEVTQNIYKNMDKPLYLRPVGKCCKQPFCYNAHAFMALGVIPEVETPTYADIRDRIDSEGKHWLTDEVMSAYSCKLCDSNKIYNKPEMILFYMSYPIYKLRIHGRRFISKARKFRRRFTR